MKNITNEIESVDIFIQFPEQLIPANLLGIHQKMGEIRLACESTTTKLKINPDAFRKSPYIFVIFRCDISELDFHFLREFLNLYGLFFNSVANLYLADWSSLPPLPNLNELRFIDATGLAEWDQFPKLISGLSRVMISNCAMDDAAIDRILKWLISTPTKNTLNSLMISFNVLTKIPRQISFFENSSLVDIAISVNSISTLRSGSFNFSAFFPVVHLNLQSNGIEWIDPGSFQGLFDFLSQIVDQLPVNQMFVCQET